MRHMLLTAIVVVGFASVGFAQSGSRNNFSGYRDRLNSFNNTPTVSPYLNLLEENTTNIDGLSGRYQTLVRPQFQSRQSLQRTQSAIRGLQNQVNQLQLNTALPASAQPLGFQNQGFSVTGHPSYFRTYSHYYPLR